MADTDAALKMVSNIEILISGLPGSGKSVFRRWLTKKLIANGFKVIAIDDEGRFLRISKEKEES